MAITLARELEQKVETIPEAQELLNKKFRFEPIKTKVADLRITQDYHIVHEKTDYEITRRALEGFLRKLGIPPRFGLKVPEDLLGTIVHRMEEIKPQEIQLFAKKNTIYGIASAKYEPPDLVEILEPLNDKKREIKMFRVGSNGFRMATLGPNIIMPRTDDKSDKIQIGIYIAANATSARPRPYARLMTYRHVCTNGVVTGTSWGEVSWPKRVPEDESAERLFCADLSQLVKHEKALIAPVKDMANRSMLDREFTKLWKLIRKITGDPDKADKMLEASKEERAKIIATVKANRKVHKEPEKITCCSAYQAFNNISAYANNQPGATAEKFQRLAGALIGAGHYEKLEEPEDED